MSRPLIVLRPREAARQTLAHARQAGIEPRSVPLFAIEAMPWAPPPGPFDGLLLTSANAVRHAGHQLDAFARLATHCVGAATAAAAAAAGLRVERAGSTDARALLAGLPAGRYLWLAGDVRTAIDPPRGTDVIAVAVYRAMPMAVDGSTLLGPAVVLVHSARAAVRLREMAPSRSTLHIVAISGPVAAACGPGWASVSVPDRPDDRAMVAIGAKLCQDPGRTASTPC